MLISEEYCVALHEKKKKSGVMRLLESFNNYLTDAD